MIILLSDLLRWLSYVENSYSLNANEELLNSYYMPNHKLIEELRKVPSDWTLENDCELASFLKNNINIDGPGMLKNIVKMISVSSQKVRNPFLSGAYLILLK